MQSTIMSSQYCIVVTAVHRVCVHYSFECYLVFFSEYTDFKLSHSFSLLFLYRGFSRKLNDLVKLHQKQHKEEAAGTRTRRAAASKEKFEPKNWKALTAQQLSKMTAMERSRYLVVCYNASFPDCQALLEPGNEANIDGSVVGS